MTRKKKFLALAALGVSVLGGGAFVYMQSPLIAAEHGGAPGQGAPQAMPVETVTIAPQQIQVWKNFSGHVIAVDRAEIRPQVSGEITEIYFEDGQIVNKGDALLVIDPRPYEAALAQAQARFDLAEKEFERAQELIKTESIAQKLMDERTNEYNSAKAALQRAQLDVDYAYVKAPISGKISRAEVTVGNLVQPGMPVLTTIVADEKVYVDFEVDEQTYVKSVRQTSGDAAAKMPVRLSLKNDTQVFEGFVQSFDNKIDPATGTIRARALFDNTNGLLLSGMSVSVQMGEAGSTEQIIVTERVIGTDQNRKFVYVIGADGTATYREIKIGESVNGSRIVTEGLAAGDVVITEGTMKLRPGVPVAPKAAATAEAPSDAPKE